MYLYPSSQILDLVPLLTEAAKRKLVALGADVTKANTVQVMGSLIGYISTSIMKGRAELTKSFLLTDPMAKLRKIFEADPKGSAKDHMATFLVDHPLVKIG